MSYKNMLRKLLFVSVASGVWAGAAHAAATDAEIQRLGQDLTCVGAERAGNAEGTIPEWSGKWLGAPDHIDFKGTGYHPVDPYAGEKPLFVITAANLNEHKDKLSAGQLALFAKYPATFQMPIYPSHRDFRYADSVCAATLENAKTAKLVDDGEGIVATTGGIAFPFPKTGLELMWNASTFSLMAWTEQYVSDNMYVLANGTRSHGQVNSSNLAEHLKPGTHKIAEGPSAYYLNITNLPSRDRGEVNTGLEYFNNKLNPRQSWMYDPGTRRVRQSPEYGFDMLFPGSGGSITVDEVRVFNGSGKRYNWNIVGKQEMYVPYNTYAIHSPDVSYDELLGVGHVNPKYMRYELHRVWVLEATLKEGYRHLYGKRTMYIDEDSMQILMGENYDARGQLWRTSMINYYYAPEAKIWQSGVGLYHDLLAGSYLAFNLVNEQKSAYTLNTGKLKPSDFGPEAARRLGL